MLLAPLSTALFAVDLSNKSWVIYSTISRILQGIAIGLTGKVLQLLSQIWISLGDINLRLCYFRDVESLADHPGIRRIICLMTLYYMISYNIPFINNIANVFVYMIALTSFRDFVRENLAAILEKCRSGCRRMIQLIRGGDQDVQDVVAVNPQTQDIEMRPIQ